MREQSLLAKPGGSELHYTLLGVEPNTNNVFANAQITCFFTNAYCNIYSKNFLYSGTRKNLYA